MKKMLLMLACATSCLCSGSLFAAQKTPGEKLDSAIDKTKEKAEEAKKKAEEAKDAAKDKCDETKKAAKKESDKVRKDIADTIKPDR